MISNEQIRLMHAYVHPLFWPVLWVNIARLWATLFRAGLEGHEQVLYYVSWNGAIRVGYMAESEAECLAWCPLGEDLDYQPWTRLVPLDLGALFCVWFGFAPSPHHGRTVFAPSAAPLLHHALDPPRTHWSCDKA